MPAHIHMNNLIQSNFDVRFTAVSAEGIDSTWLGRKLDNDCISDLATLEDQFGINVDGEGGEFETTVLSAPWFDSLEWETKAEWGKNRGSLDIIDVWKSNNP